MRPATTVDVIELTERLFRLLDEGDADALRALVSPNAAETLTPELMLDTWARAVADAGNLLDCRDTGIDLLDGTPVPPPEDVGMLGSLVGHTRLECEAGTWVGRVAFDPDRRVIGLLVVPPDHGELSF
jgi:hypothetical protein